MFEIPRCLALFSLLLLVITIFVTCIFFIKRDSERVNYLLGRMFKGHYDITSRQIGELVYFNGDSKILKTDRGKKEILHLILHPGTYLRDVFGTSFGHKKSFTDPQYDAFLKPGMLLK